MSNNTRIDQVTIELQGEVEVELRHDLDVVGECAECGKDLKTSSDFDGDTVDVVVTPCELCSYKTVASDIQDETIEEIIDALYDQEVVFKHLLAADSVSDIIKAVMETKLALQQHDIIISKAKTLMSATVEQPKPITERKDNE